MEKDKYINIFSAPIAGYTNWPLRQIFNEYGATRIFSEMVHVREILHRKIEDIPLIKENYKFAIQLFGSFEDDFISATRIALDFCDNIDINCGCPVKKVIKAKGGVFWLSDIENFSRKIYEISSFFPNKISVKIRLGFKKPQITEILESIKSFPLLFITIHMRTGSMLFSGKAQYQYAELINNFNIPIILNGDINTPEFAKNILDNYSCGGIMIGRAALSNPLIFSQIKNYLKTKSYEKTKTSDRIDNLIKYIDYLKKYILLFSCKSSDPISFKRESIIGSRKILFMLIKGIPYSTKFKDLILKINTEDDLKSLKDLLIDFKSSQKNL